MSDQQFIPLVFIGAVTFFIALALARGVRGLRAGQWSVVFRAVLLGVFVVLVFFFLPDNSGFPLPLASPAAWLTIAVVLVATLTVNLVLLPFLSDRLEMNVVVPGTVALALLGFAGASFWLMQGRKLTIQPAAFVGAACLIVLAVVLGVGVLVRRRRG